LLPAGTSSSKNDAALCRLSQNSLLRLVIPVPERAVPDVHAGESVVVNVSGLNKTIQGKIVRFSDQIDTATRTMHTEVDVANSRGELVPGMYASVKIPLHSAANVLMVPIQAVQAAGEGKGIVLVVDRNNKIEKRAVSVGLQSGANEEITSGLQENETIVFGSQGAYQPGELVSPKLVEPSAAE
jgi:RND family efflux transporter MFP subunit